MPLLSLFYFFDLIRQKLSPPQDVRPSFSGRTALVTGGNKGLGFEVALKLVQCGCERVIIGVRSIKAGEEAAALIEERTSRKGVMKVLQLDMEDYASIKMFVERVEKESARLDFAILNAGISSNEWVLSQYGLERTLQINTVSTALLALLLLPKLKASWTSEFTPVLELVGSSNHYEATISKEVRSSDQPLRKSSERREWSTSAQLDQYSLSKLFLMYVQSGLVQSLQESDPDTTPVAVIVVCPGSVYSDMTKAYTAWYMPMVVWITRILIMKPAEQGARTYISGLVLGTEGHDKFWQADRFRPKVPQLEAAESIDLGRKVWAEIVESLQKNFPEISVSLKR